MLKNYYQNVLVVKCLDWNSQDKHFSDICDAKLTYFEVLNLVGGAAQKFNSLRAEVHTKIQEITPQYFEYFQQNSVALSQWNVPAKVLF